MRRILCEYFLHSRHGYFLVPQVLKFYVKVKDYLC